MASGLGTPGANTGLDAIGAAHSWVGLHVGAPGAAGTANNATETTRKQTTWAAAAAAVLASNAVLTWTAIAGTQDATDFTAKSASSAGNFGFSGSVTANGYVAGDTYSVASGALTASFTTAT